MVGRLCLVGLSFSVLFELVFAGHVSDHGPIGVAADHTHKQNEWMLSYRLMQMTMQGMGSGTQSLSDTQYQGMVKPQDMDMRMHMFGAMYGVTNLWTFMAMLNYQTRDMSMFRPMNGASFETRSQGLGDSSLSALFKAYQDSKVRIVAQTGVTLPTGSITEKDVVPGMGLTQLPYPMQLGSGSFDPFVGLTSVYAPTDLSFGSQIRSTMRLEKNSQQYQLGSEYEASLWTAYAFNDSLSLSLRALLNSVEQIEGQAKDLRLTGAMNPLADEANSGRTVLSGLIGLNYLIRQGPAKGARLGLEVSSPWIDNIKGVQMRRGVAAVLGTQYSF